MVADSTHNFCQWLRDSQWRTGEEYEYRFLMSGLAYNGSIQGEAFKSSLGGQLLTEPFSCWTVGLQEQAYPSELSAVFRAKRLEIKHSENAKSSLVPHEEIANDIACALTLFFRRLVICVGAISESVSPPYASSFPSQRLAHPIAQKSRATYFWPQNPLTTITSVHGVSYHVNMPDPVRVEESRLREFLDGLAAHPKSRTLLDGVRMYHRAMECLFRQPDISYLLLVCAAEAGASTLDSALSEEEKLALPAAQLVAKTARSKGFDKPTIRELALASVTGSRKSKTQMFCDFLTAVGSGHESLSPLFFPEILGAFPIAAEMSALRRAYAARSEYVHDSQRMMPEALMGVTPGIPTDVVLRKITDSKESAPPIMWLERIVAHSLQNAIRGRH